MNMIEQSNHQQLDQNPKSFERHAFGPILLSDWLDTVLVQARWSETGQIKAVVRPTSLWQPNQQMSGISVLNSYQNPYMFAM